MKGPRLSALLAFYLCGALSCFSQMFDSTPNVFARRGGLEGAHFAGVSGVVTTPDGSPLAETRVEIRNQQTGATVASGYTNGSGSFDFESLPPAFYEIVVTKGMAEARQQLTLNDVGTNIKIRLDTRNAAAAQADGNATVSVAEYRVPQKARDAFHKAEAALTKGHRDEVQKQLAKSLEIYPDYAPALTLRGVMSLDEAKAQPAAEDFDHAIHSDPNFAMAYTGMAAAMNMLQKFDDAVRSAERAITLSPNSWQAYFEAAKSYVGKADYQKSLQQLSKAQQLCTKDYPPIHLVRAHILLALKEYGSAVNELQAFLTLAPQDVNASTAREALAKVKALAAAAAPAAASTAR